MPEMKPLEQFYSYRGSWIQRIFKDLTDGLYIARSAGTLIYDGSFDVQIDAGKPLVIGDALASNWLLANYLFATNFAEGRPPAMGEISASIHDNHQEPAGIYIDFTCFDDIQAVFRAMREIEDVYRKEFAEPILEIFNKGLIIKDMDGFIETSDTTRAFAEVVGNHYNPQKSISYPILYNGVWAILTPSLSYARKYRTEDDGYVFRDMHSHPPDISWLGSFASAGDFGCMLNGDFRSIRYGMNENMKPYESYVMHMPKALMMNMDGDEEVLGCRNDAKKKLEVLHRKRDMFMHSAEFDMMGTRFKWEPGRRAMVVSPVVSESHYRSVAGSVPEGTFLGLNTCRIYGGGKEYDFNPIGARQLV